MLFNSISYLIFLPIVVCIYFILPQRFRWVLLLTASYLFYMCWKPEYIILIVLSTIIDYYCARKIGAAKTTKKRRLFLIISLCTNLGLLFGFKYFNFMNNSMHHVFTALHLPYSIPYLNVLLPVGISFYTFQTLSYTIDVYRGQRQPESHFGIFAVYVSFFPQLVAGPIERSTHLMPQFRIKHSFNYQRVTNGIKLIAWGFFKKIVIADRLAIYVNEVYNHPDQYHGWAILLATYFFAFQIYCDFSGYSDIAIGSARIMGYSLMNNFNRPYFSRSISEFWSRWHVSLSTWFRDYLYIPLGGNRVAKNRWYANLFVVFLVSGLWHGANWTFVLWGAMHGSFLIFSHLTKNIRNHLWDFLGFGSDSRIKNIVQIIATFHLVLFSWIFFRANSLSEAFLLIRRLFIFEPFHVVLYPVITRSYLIISILAIVFMETIHIIQIRQSPISILSRQSSWVRWTAYYAFVLSILLFGTFDSQAFIYFQF